MHAYDLNDSDALSTENSKYLWLLHIPFCCNYLKPRFEAQWAVRICNWWVLFHHLAVTNVWLAPSSEHRYIQQGTGCDVTFEKEVVGAGTRDVTLKGTAQAVRIQMPKNDK